MYPNLRKLVLIFEIKDVGYIICHVPIYFFFNVVTWHWIDVVSTSICIYMKYV